MSVLDAIARPEYTGERRCWPCTAVNLGLVAVVCGALLFVGRLPIAAVVGTVGVALVALRGYVVPYTPRFAPRIAAALPGDVFGHDARPAGTVGTLGPDDDVDGEALLSSLVEAGVLAVDGEDLMLDRTFEDRWHEHMASLRTDESALRAAVRSASPAAEVSVSHADGREWFVLGDGTGRVQDQTWVTRPVAIADAAAVRALQDYLPAEDRPAAAGALRMFLTECPECSTALEESTTASCCGGQTDPTSSPDPVLACPDCGVWLYRFPDAAG